MAIDSTAAKMQKELAKQAEEMTKKKATTANKTAAKEEVVQDEKFADIEGNTFHKIIFSELSPEQKKEAVTKALTYDATLTKEQNITRLKEFDLFKEYLQMQRKNMAQEIIRLTDTEAFGELKDVYEQINGAVAEFDNSMKPLTDIIDAVYNLRMKGGDVTINVFKEIQDDKAHEAERAAKLKEQADKLLGLQATIETNNKEIAVLGEQKWLFGLGGVKKSAREKIALIQLEQQKANGDLTQVTADLEALKTAPTRESQFAELAAEKAKLRELLDISSTDHKERQKRLVEAAQNFVNTTETRVGSVLNHFGKMEGQITGLFDANNGLQSIYAIVSEATTDASKENKGNRDSLIEPKADENAMAKMSRESKKMAIEDYITNLDSSSVDTAKTFADLTSQSYRIKGMKDANREQVNKTRQLHSSGVAGVADRLSTVLQIVSGAALNEASEMTSNTVNSMNDKTNIMSLKESMSSAARIKDVSGSLEKAIDDLQAYRDTARVVSQTARDNLQEVKANQEILRGIIQETQQAVKESIAVNADVDMQGGDTTAPTNDNKAAKKTQKTEDSMSKLGKLGGM